MRTTLTIEDQLAQALRRIAYESGRSFKDVVNETIRAGLGARGDLPQPKPYKLKPSSLGGVRPGIDLDHALRLAGELEDEEIAAKLRMRK
ncbi:MAG TPA: DUF2191 domain-containing protein [Acidobacteriota bacterium]|nr:DUF2191 domain-containing protein [Acidobacteriota bacterium]